MYVLHLLPSKFASLLFRLELCTRISTNKPAVGCTREIVPGDDPEVGRGRRTGVIRRAPSTQRSGV